VSEINWAEIRSEYENSDIILKDLANKYGISPGTVRSRKNREQWQRNEIDIKKNVAMQRNENKSVATSIKNKKAIVIEKSRRETIEIIGDNLSSRQLLFVQEYPVDLNAKKAALRAGYAESSADKYAASLLNNPKIQDAIRQVMAERAKRLQITADRVLEEYAKIGFADIKDFLTFETKEVVVDVDKNGKPITDYQTVVSLKPSYKVDGTMISEVSLKDGSLKFKLHDKKGALDMIGKHLGMFIEKHEHTGKDGGPIEVTNARERLVSRIHSLASRRREGEAITELN